MSASSDRAAGAPIILHKCGSSFLVWSARDALQLILGHRIIGEFTGSSRRDPRPSAAPSKHLASPCLQEEEETEQQQQEEQEEEEEIPGSLAEFLRDPGRGKGLPLCLSAYEAAVLAENGLCRCVASDDTDVELSSRDVIERAVAHFEAQLAGFAARQRTRPLDPASIAVKRSRLSAAEADNLPPDSVVRLGLSMLSAADASRFPTLRFRLHTPLESEASDVWPSVDPQPSNPEKLVVFRDLWRRGFALIDGLRFGADWAVYRSGKPWCEHADLLVLVEREGKGWRAEQLVRICRLAGGVRKKVLLAAVSDGHVRYSTLKWSQRMESMS